MTPTFAPVIGKSYGTPDSIFPKRLLILGSSFYLEGACDEGFVMSNAEGADFGLDIIGMYLDPDFSAPWKKTYSTFINSIFGHATSIDERESFFDSVVFYNYLQVPAGENPYSADNYDYTAEIHCEAFLHVVENTKPEIVISWGDKVWDALPNEWGYGMAKWGEPLALDPPFGSYMDYPFGNETIRLIGAHHPSTGYPSEYHHEIFKGLGVVADSSINRKPT
ncbi:MAG: hypothetical protein J0M04_22885 [Verrucomicrobia bacterium]|nr:hypothetical protein [Verrucomicrobiota bacterium]